MGDGIVLWCRFEWFGESFDWFDSSGHLTEASFSFRLTEGSLIKGSFERSVGAFFSSIVDVFFAV